MKPFKLNKSYDNIFHQVLSHLLKNTNSYYKKIKKHRLKLKQLSDKHIQYFESISVLKGNPNSILQKYRHYEVDDLTGVFDLERFHQKKDISELFWYHWEYYCFDTPFWEKKMREFSAKKIEKSKNILFSNDNSLENFYEKYSYDIDELPKDVSYKSIKSLNKHHISDFIFKYFKIFNIKISKNKMILKK